MSHMILLFMQRADFHKKRRGLHSIPGHRTFVCILVQIITDTAAVW